MSFRRTVHRATLYLGLLCLVLGGGLLGILADGGVRPAAAADDDAFPTRAVRIVVPFPAGGTADILPRIVGEKLREKWGQAVIVENKTGAGGNIGADAVAKADPDGYTLLAAPPGPIAINGALYKRLSYDPQTFEPITVLGVAPSVLAVRPDFPAKTVAEVVAYAKANPGKVTFASQGNGSTSHLSGFMFQKLTGTEMVHVPYRGTAPALQDLMGGSVDIFFDNLGSSLPLHVGGKLRILAVGGAERVTSLPDIPTVQEAGVKGFKSVTWFAAVAPARTPRAVIDTLQKTMADAIKAKDTVEQFGKIGVTPAGFSTAETARFIAEERALWTDVIQAAGVSAE